MTGRGSQPASVPPWNPNKPAAPTPPVGSAPRTSPTTVATEPRPHTSSNQPDVISREILDLYDPDAINATSQTNLVDTVPDYPMDSLPRGSSARSLANTNNQPSSSVNQSENVRTSQNSNSSSRTPQTSTGSAVRTNSNSAPRTNTNSAPRTSTNSAPRTSSSSAPRTSSSSAPRTSTSSDPNQTVGPVPSSVVTNTGLLPQAHPVTLAPRNLVPAHTQVYTVSHSTHSTSIPAVSHANVSVNINHAALPSIPVGTATTSSDTRHIRTQNLNVGVVTSRLDHIRQSGGALPDVVAHSQPSARTPSSSQRPPLPTIDPRAAQGHSSHRSGERDPHSRHHSRHPRDNRHSRPRRHSHRQTPPGVEEPCKESCLKCLAAGMSFRWILVVLSLLGVCCVVTGIVLAALHAAGNSFLFLAIMFIGLGVLLVVVVGVGWKCTPRGHEPLHALFNLGDFRHRRGRRRRGHHRREGRWYGGTMYPEFQYRRPPPSYNASMQEYQNQLALAQTQNPEMTPDLYDPENVPDEDYSLPSSPPPSYRSRASTVRAGIQITFPPNHGGDFPDSRPPTYRSHPSNTLQGHGRIRPSLTRDDDDDDMEGTPAPADVAFTGSAVIVDTNPAQTSIQIAPTNPNQNVTVSVTTVSVTSQPVSAPMLAVANQDTADKEATPPPVLLTPDGASEGVVDAVGDVEGDRVETAL